MHYAFEIPAADNMISQGPASPLAYAVIRPTRTARPTLGFYKW